MTIWEFDDAAGARHRGKVQDIFDRGGTDVSHGMMAACGRYLMLSGQRLRDAKIYTKDEAPRCPHQEEK